ncbi:MAG: alpha/beta hydrolase [Anaerolineales bacterium]|jgi:pimeloyl-ACP methyl ester carboxylesterase
MPTAAGLYYFAHGEELRDRPPVLLLHGAGGSHLSWPPQIRRLTGQRIFALDLPGHGKSDGVGMQDIDEYAKSVYEFMKSVHLSNVVVVGISMGSAIAMSLALTYRKRVIGLGLIGSGAKLRVAASTLEGAANSSTFLPVVETVIENSYGSNVDPRVKELAVQQMAETRRAVLYGDFLACDAFDVMERVDKIDIPTLIICGSQDRMTPPSRSTYLHEHIEGSQMHILEGTGHMAMIEQPEMVAGLLAEFVEQTPY